MRLYLKATCINDDFFLDDDKFDSVYVELSPEYIETIKRLATFAKSERLASIHKFDNEGCWFLSPIVEGENIQSFHEIIDTYAQDNLVGVDDQRVEVTPSGFRFVCVPSNCPEDCEYRTEIISLTELNSGRDFIAK
ncbi:hypothetical protein [Idiomarina abyssalis]|uniref:Uncharacterized protein n=1 Tax=Idiomarina abyssalis TaxID=86102 RepID=A0A8I1KK60_9GAMM|nr:hypothetical protein [Idiomarina abyssalis]MBJ7265522.1 hypothetical protein [Idiomarina abyssalis]MBJ7316804.1 hypothetical protein [Idiomarina abyssalis]